MYTYSKNVSYMRPIPLILPSCPLCPVLVSVPLLHNQAYVTRPYQDLMFTAPVYKLWPTKLWKLHTRHADRIVEIAMHYVKQVRTIESRDSKTKYLSLKYVIQKLIMNISNIYYKQKLIYNI